MSFIWRGLFTVRLLKYASPGFWEPIVFGLSNKVASEAGVTILLLTPLLISSSVAKQEPPIVLAVKSVNEPVLGVWLPIGPGTDINDGILEGVNLIPSGALHKELNHLSDKLPDVDITRKGIPVIKVEEGGKIQNQLAEIEQSELVLHLSITKKLEELKKQYDNGNEEALLEAGKLLTDELLYNVNDNTNLLKQVS